VESGKYIIADAVMFMINRKLSPDVVITDIEEVQKQIDFPKNFELKQNYPNPFNPSTTIEYSLKESGFVNLSIFDMLGQKIAEPVNEEKTPGNYKVNFNAEGNSKSLSTGVYFYTLRISNFSVTNKMVYLK